MLRSHPLSFLAVLLAAALALVPRPAAALDPDEVHWNLIGQNSIAMGWRGTSNVVRYGTTTGYGSQVTAIAAAPRPLSSAGPFWQARINGLAEATLYHYSIGTGPDHTFRTPPPRGGIATFDVIAEGDVGSTLVYSRVGTIQSQIGTAAPRFVLMVGDLTYADDYGLPNVDQHFNDAMAWSQDAAYMPAWGNHDGSPPDSMDDYKGRFDLPNPRYSPGAPPGGEDWYWFDYQNVRFIAYPEPYSDAWSDWYPRASALMDSAQADTSLDYIVTFGHRAAYSSGHHLGSATLKGYLDALGASHTKYVLNVNGHSHNYERSFKQNGVTHITVGIGGANLEAEAGPCLYAGGCPAPSWSAFRAFHHGYLRLRISGTSISCSAICGPAGDANNPNDLTCTPGSIMDSFTIPKPPDAAPVVTAPSSAEGIVGSTMQVNVSATDPDGSAIGSLTANLDGLPAGHNAVFTSAPDHRSGTLTWTPAPSHAGGPYTVVFSAQNALSNLASSSLWVSSMGGNQVANSSFEGNFNGWNGYHGGTLELAAGGHQGSWTLRINGPVSLTQNFGVNDSPNWVASSPAVGTRYRFRAWVRSASSTGNARLQIREYLGNTQQGQTLYSDPAPLSPLWTMIYADYVTVSSGSSIDFQVIDEPNAGGESFDLDEVAIQVVPSGTSDVPAILRAGPLMARFAPNPTHAGGALAFTLTRPGALRAEILDLTGRRIRTLLERRSVGAGDHTVRFDGRDERGIRLEPGVYFFHVRAAEGAAHGRFLVLK
jgi:hypothetical protein